MRYLSELERRALLSATHGLIEKAAADALQRITGSIGERRLSYPPDRFDSAVLDGPIVLSPDQTAFAEATIREEVANACFNLFCLIDGVADPPGYNQHWPGFNLTAHQENAEEPFLHEDFLPAYWHWLDEAANE